MPSIGNMRKLLIFSVPLGFASVLGTLTRQLANVIVSFLSSPKEFAIYANGAKEVPLVGIVASSIAVVIMADMSKKIQEGDRQSALSLFKKASITSACFILPVMCFLMIYANNFIEILYTKKYIDSVTPFRIYLLILPIRIVYYGSAFVALGISKLILYRSAVELIITSILCYVFVKFFGAYSAALAIVVTLYFFSAPYNLFTLGKEFGCSAFQIIPFRMIGNILLLSVIAALPAAMILIIKLNPVVSLVLGGMVYSVAYALLAYKFVPDFRSVTIQSSDKIKSILKLKR